MTLLSIEFPVKKTITRAEFAAQVIAWIQGMNSTSLFNSGDSLDNFSDEFTISSESGETLVLKEITQDDGFVIGARHEVSDNEDRIWRSEVVLTSLASGSALRSRSQCISTSALARVQVPKKPFIVNMAIDDKWPDKDGNIDIDRNAIHLKEEDTETTADLMTGVSAVRLPVIYISRNEHSNLPLGANDIGRLASRLGGIAHVMTEPSKAFSTRLRGLVSGRNPYRGSVGVCVAPHGLVRRFFLGDSLPTAEDLSRAVYNFCIQLSSNKKAQIGWDWQDILDRNAKDLRNRVKQGSEELGAWMDAQDKESSEKDRTIADLREQISTLQEQALNTASAEDEVLSPTLRERIGREFYRGEFADRFRLICATVTKQTDSDLDPRTIALAEKLIGTTRYSGNSQKLKMRINAAGKDSATADKKLGDILLELGFSKRLDGGHPVMSPTTAFGVSTQTLSSSPSDHRAGKNAASRIIRDLGLRNLGAQ